MPTCFITGVTGQDGAYLSQLLLGKGYRVIGTSQKGEFTIPKSIANTYPAVLNLRVYGLNGNGKLYALDRVLKATE